MSYTMDKPRKQCIKCDFYPGDCEYWKVDRKDKGGNKPHRVAPDQYHNCPDHRPRREYNNSEKQPIFGLWTCNAECLCPRCLGVDVCCVPDREVMGVTTCDKCGCAIVLDNRVAAEHNLSGKIRELGIDAHMWQTGGMTSGVGILKQIGGYYLITCAEDNEYDFLCCEYGKTGEVLKEYPACGENRMLAFVNGLENAKRIGKTWEWCQACETEVALEEKMETQICPSCGKKIYPCTYCIDTQGDCPSDSKCRINGQNK